MTEQTQPRRSKRGGRAGQRVRGVALVRVRLLRPHVHQNVGYDADDVIDVHPETARWMQARGLIEILAGHHQQED